MGQARKARKGAMLVKWKGKGERIGNERDFVKNLT